MSKSDSFSVGYPNLSGRHCACCRGIHAEEEEHTDVPADPTLRGKTLESLQVKKGIVDPGALDVLVETFP